MRARLALLLAGAVLLPACGGNDPAEDPIGDAVLTQPPRADSDLVFASGSWSTQPGRGRELFAVADDGSGLLRLTRCNTESRRCDTPEAAPAPDRRRMALRRVRDNDNDGRLTATDGEALVVSDLVRSVEGQIAPPTAQVSGIDWSPVAETLVYSALGEGSRNEELYRIDSNGENNRALTVSANIRERRPRIDPAGSVAAFERIDTAVAGARSEIWIFQTSAVQVRVTEGGPGSDLLSGTPYVVGSDTDPDYSPDGRSLVFRRLTATGNGGLGTWDLYTIRTDRTSLTRIVSGPAFRGAPDWGPQGIVFPEVDVAAGSARLVVVQPDGSGSRAIFTQASSLELGAPRWLR